MDFVTIFNSSILINNVKVWNSSSHALDDANRKYNIFSK